VPVLTFRNAAVASLFLSVVAGAQTVTQGQLIVRPTTSFPATATAATLTGPGIARSKPHFNLKAALRNAVKGASASTPLVNPDPTPQHIFGAEGDFFGFPGATHFDSAHASNGDQFSVEPPDQGLAVGNGFVFEAVNEVVIVFNKAGARLAGAGLNAFFGLPPAIIPGTTPVYGPTVGDPRAYYDQQLQRWFVTAYEQDVDSSTGAFLNQTRVLLAVSTTANPLGTYYQYALNTINDGTGGTPSHPGCPCFPDQPLNGADAYGFYISTNEFPNSGPGFNGAQVYATSKQMLASGTPGIVVLFSSMPLAEGLSYSIQPARSLTFPNTGTEYFLSALDFNGTLDNRIAIWAMTNTSTLASASPKVLLVKTVLNSETYGTVLVGGVQPTGPRPLGTSLGEPEETLNPDDDRMEQVVHANGELWAGLNTVIGGNPGGSQLRNGIAYFVVKPVWSVANGLPTLSGVIDAQGYVAGSGLDSVMYPSIGVSPNGDAAMAFTLTGPAIYPSMAFLRVGVGNGAGPIQVGGAGTGPEDGFSGYVAYGGNGVARWGDYSAAVGDTDGIWMAAEWIPNTPRTSLANWGTFIGRLP